MISTRCSKYSLALISTLKGDNVTTLTTLSTVAKAVLAALTHAEDKSREKLVTIQSFAASQKEIVATLEKATGEAWTVSHTTKEQELDKANALMEQGEYLYAFYGWIKAAILGEGSRLEGWEEGNGLFGLEKEDLHTVVGKIVRGEEV